MTRVDLFNGKIYFLCQTILLHQTMGNVFCYRFALVDFGLAHEAPVLKKTKQSGNMVDRKSKDSEHPKKVLQDRGNIPVRICVQYSGLDIWKCNKNNYFPYKIKYEIHVLWIAEGEGVFWSRI